MSRFGRLIVMVMGLSGVTQWSGAESTARLSMLKGIGLDGNVCRPGESAGCKGVVFVFLSPECPVSKDYLPDLGKIHKECKTRSVEMYGVISDRQMTRAEGIKFADKHQPDFPILFDGSQIIARSLRPTHLPEAFLIDPEGAIRYRGRIDDRFDAELKRREEILDHSLMAAVSALSDGSTPTPPRTDAVGYQFDESDYLQPDQVTFNRDIAPILYANCTECHRKGEVAPFELANYEQAAKRAGFLAEVAATRLMPPWKADLRMGHFMGERLLHPDEIALLAAWAKQGAPEGVAEDLPTLPQFTSGWQLGKPDLIVQMTEPYTVPAAGADQNRFFVIPIEIPEDKVVIAAEFRPGNPRVVHHAILYLDTSGTARARDAETPEPGYEGFVATGLRGGALGFWAPGYTARFYPEGVGQHLAKNTDLALQLHYHPSGKEEVDRSMVGIHFADKPLSKRIGGLAMINFDVDIPAGAADHRMSHSFTTPTDLEIVDVVPHMHMIGTEMVVKATKPDGEVVPLIWSNWDFNWQDVYRYKEIIHLPKGTTIDLEAKFDNSSGNPYNPSTPPQRVMFGEETTDEMCICAFRLIEDSDSPEERKALQSALREDMMQQMKDPKVFVNVTRFMMNGRGQGTPKKAD